jgi:hypothetical protein
MKIRSYISIEFWDRLLMAEFGEFALLDSEGMPVGYAMQKYNWTETSLSITF